MKTYDGTIILWRIFQIISFIGSIGIAILLGLAWIKGGFEFIKDIPYDSHPEIKLMVIYFSIVFSFLGFIMIFLIDLMISFKKMENIE